MGGGIPVDTHAVSVPGMSPSILAICSLAKKNHAVRERRGRHRLGGNVGSTGLLIEVKARPPIRPR